MTILTVPAPRRRRSALLTSVIAISMVVTGCSATAPGELGHLQQLAQTCPDEPINSFIQIDGSGSGLTDAIAEERLEIIGSVVERTVVCSGHLTVQGFSSSSGATVSIYDGDLTLTAPTLNARLRQSPEAVEAVMADITAAYEPALGSLPKDGSDITSVLRLFAEQAQQFPEFHLDAYLLSDGAQNMGAIRVSEGLTPEQAEDLAEQLSVPILPADSTLTIAGIGRVSGDPLPSAVVEGMVSLYTAIALKTGAGESLVVTDLAAAQ